MSQLNQHNLAIFTDEKFIDSYPRDVPSQQLVVSTKFRRVDIYNGPCYALCKERLYNNNPHLFDRSYLYQRKNGLIHGNLLVLDGLFSFEEIQHYENGIKTGWNYTYTGVCEQFICKDEFYNEKGELKIIVTREESISEDKIDFDPDNSYNQVCEQKNLPSIFFKDEKERDKLDYNTNVGHLWILKVLAQANLKEDIEPNKAALQEIRRLQDEDIKNGIEPYGDLWFWSVDELLEIPPCKYNIEQVKNNILARPYIIVW